MCTNYVAKEMTGNHNTITTQMKPINAPINWGGGGGVGHRVVILKCSKNNYQNPHPGPKIMVKSMVYFSSALCN